VHHKGWCWTFFDLNQGMPAGHIFYTIFVLAWDYNVDAGGQTPGLPGRVDEHFQCATDGGREAELGLALP
jgi:hypothetical protein